MPIYLLSTLYVQYGNLQDIIYITYFKDFI